MPGVTFEEMLTLRVVRGLRASGMRIAAIRRVAFMAAAEFGSPTPLPTQGFRSRGAELVLAMEDAQRTLSDPDAPEVSRPREEVMGWQRVFADIVDHTLFAHVDWHGGCVVRWWPMGHDRPVVVDPRTLDGEPHIATTHVATAAVAAAVRSTGSPMAVAEAKGLSPRQVRHAVFFEDEWTKVTRHQKWLQPPEDSDIDDPSRSDTMTESPA